MSTRRSDDSRAWREMVAGATVQAADLEVLPFVRALLDTTTYPTAEQMAMTLGMGELVREVEP